ncbi:unnamed protein product [Adineta steineri]|uniref:Uncharacterized protein n=1 Tax=Adineta steineri TaxID=433720 RepID=A0A815M0S0_9BILA|nr:unnamed protein product [Adineta steineri]CAF4060833.1 unnamed protein product [Adineta steineri]
MLPRVQKPTLRDFMIVQAQTRTQLCLDKAVFDPCIKLTQLTSFEMATITSWYSDSAYGNQYNDPRFPENVNMLIQMFDGTKHQNRATLSTSYNIPDGRRASIIGASVGDPYARVSQQHYEGNGISGAHNRFTHYPCPVMKAIKINSGTKGVVSNMVPSLQHIYSVSFLLGKIEYVVRQNVYDTCEKKISSKCEILFLHKACLYFLKDVYNSDVEEKWNRLRPTSNRQYHHLSSKIEIELEEPQSDASYENSKSAHFYMFNRVYKQWEEATETEKQEHEAIISFKNSAKIPRYSIINLCILNLNEECVFFTKFSFICNFARFRSIMKILWDDDVYALIEVSEVVKPPYRVSQNFIEAVKKAIDKQFPANLCKDDGTKILVIEKDTAKMGDIFFGYADNVSRQLFDLSSIQEKFNTSPGASRLLKTSDTKEKQVPESIVYGDALVIVSSKFIFFSAATFISYREFHNSKDRLSTAIKYLIDNGLAFQPSNKTRFIKGTRTSYVMATPNQIKHNNMAVEALNKINLNITDYEQLWKECLLFTTEVASKIEKIAIDHINFNLIDYISIIHRLGNANDPISQEILKPGLLNGQIGINPETNTFSLSHEHIIQTKDDAYVMNLLKKICNTAVAHNNDSSKKERTSTIMIDLSEPATSNMSSSLADDVQRLQTPLQLSSIYTDIVSNENDQIENFKEQNLFNEKPNETVSTSTMDSIIRKECSNVLTTLVSELKNNHEKGNIMNDDVIVIRQMSNTDNSMYDLDSSSPIALNNIVVEELSASVSNSVEYDYPTDGSKNTDSIDASLNKQQRENQIELFSEISSSITTDEENNKQQYNSESGPMEIDIHSNLKTTSSPNTTSSEHTDVSIDLNQTSTESQDQSDKTFNIIALSKKLMLKPFIVFTKTDATRLYNNAETKNIVIGYLQQHGLIKQIDDLFLINIPTKKITKSEIGYLKMFPNSQSASNTASFEVKLREKVGITFDNYVGKVLNSENASTSTSVINNMFNTAYHKWLLNREWYDKIKEGYFSEYYQNKIICPDANMSLPMVTVASVSSDNVQDLLDRPRSTLTASQRTNNELRRLGAKRQQVPSDEPPPKRLRKPRRFADDN